MTWNFICNVIDVLFEVIKQIQFPLAGTTELPIVNGNHMNVLVIAPHPDDEIIGCGGTIARLIQQNCSVFVLILTKGMLPLFTEEIAIRAHMQALNSHEFLGIKETIFFDFPATALSRVDHSDVNIKISQVLKKIKPELLFIPFNADIHIDHQCAFTSSLVAARPDRNEYPRKILAYETLSSTNWNAPYLTPGFHPNIFFDITHYLQIKLNAFKIYQDQIKDFPHERSLEALTALATLRGCTIHRPAAESFVLIREVI